jgi:hypothetical protein
VPRRRRDVPSAKTRPDPAARRPDRHYYPARPVTTTLAGADHATPPPLPPLPSHLHDGSYPTAPHRESQTEPRRPCR